MDENEERNMHTLRAYGQNLENLYSAVPVTNFMSTFKLGGKFSIICGLAHSASQPFNSFKLLTSLTTNKKLPKGSQFAENDSVFSL